MWIERLAIGAVVFAVLSPLWGWGLLQLINWWDKRHGVADVAEWANPMDVTPKNLDAKTKRVVDYRRF